MRQLEDKMPAENLFQLRQAGERILQLYADWEKPGPAAEWKQKLNASQ